MLLINPCYDEVSSRRYLLYFIYSRSIQCQRFVTFLAAIKNESTSLTSKNAELDSGISHAHHQL